MDWEKRNTVNKELQSLHMRGGSIEPADVVRIALRAGLTSSETLTVMHDYLGFRPESRVGRPGSLVFALGRLVTSVCRRAQAARVLEYSATASLLTAELSDARPTYISPNRSVLDALNLLFPDSSAVFAGADGLPVGSSFDAIICQPPIGNRVAGNERADGFGGEVVLDLTQFVVPDGLIFWITGRGVLFNGRTEKTFDGLRDVGFNILAAIELPSGAFPWTPIEGQAVVLKRAAAAKKLVGALRDMDTAEPLAAAMLAGNATKAGPSWIWLDANDRRGFFDVEKERLVRQLVPRGRHAMMPLGSLLTTERVERADKEPPQSGSGSYLYVPEYAGSSVTADLDEQTVKPNAVYRLPVDPKKANPRFLAHLLNGPFGRHVRDAAARGATIQRVGLQTLLYLELPVPDVHVQDRIARLGSDVGILNATLSELQGTLARDWTVLNAVGEKIEKLKAVFDIEKQIAEWWRVLPYPLATVYRRYQVSSEPKDRLDTQLHFFELAAIYLASIGASHVRALRANWQEVLGDWLHPPRNAGIERADFGFWINLAAASLKDTSRIAGDKGLRQAATELAGLELVELAGAIGQLGRSTEVLDVARRYRNAWKGHGGHVKASDAERLCAELHQQIRVLYEVAAPLFDRLLLVRPGQNSFDGSFFRYEVETLAGSDPTFDRVRVALERPARTGMLGFWMRDAKVICEALPFFRLGAPQEPQEKSFYVFNRVEDGMFRWISYQETREQEYVASDDELAEIVRLGRLPDAS